MIGVVIVERAGREFYRFEFPIESDEIPFGQTWSEGIKDAFETFRRNYPDVSLFGDDIRLAIGERDP